MRLESKTRVKEIWVALTISVICITAVLTLYC